MSSGSVLALIIVIGAVAGLRSGTPPMVLAWAVHWGWLMGGSSFFFAFFFESVQTIWSVFFITAIAIVEIAFDKNPKTPSRLTVWPLTARIVLGACSAALLSEVGGLSVLLGTVLGATAAVAAAYAANRIRASLVRELKVPDAVVGFAEDAIAIGLGFLVVSRFS